MTPTLRQSVLDAAANPELVQAVQQVYIDLQRQIESRKPLCVMSGKCCRFEEYGHRLYVTTAELAAFLAPTHSPGTPGEGRGEGFLPIAPASWNGTGCPYQQNKLCSVHPIRPFGCRIYFCDPTAQQWQQDLYEQLHARLKALHEQFDIPYRYLEWRQALIDCGLVETPISL